MSKKLERYHRVDMPGMYVIFSTFDSDFYAKNKNPGMEIIHTHCCYEATFSSRDGKDICIVSPPFCQHSTLSVSPGERFSFMFVMTGSKPDRICEVFLRLEESVEIEDNFGIVAHAKEIRRLAIDMEFGTKELISAEMRIIVVKLAKTLNSGVLEQLPKKQSLEEERELRLENFFANAIKDPNCSKLQLADMLGVSERQLTRILKELYGKNYHDLVLASRMGFAQAFLEKGEPIEEVMAKSGYVSRRTFERAYKKYFGHSITKNDANKDVNT